jgi:type I restriction enzyme S subunit
VTPKAPWLPVLPDRWEVVQMRRLVTFRNGADYKDVEVDEGGFPVYGSGGEFRRASNYLYDGPSVLFGRKGTTDRPLLVSGKFWTVDTMFYTELGDAIEPRFLHHYATTMPFSYYSTSTAAEHDSG